MPSSQPPDPDATESDHRRLLPTLLIPAFVTLLAVSSVNVILPAVSQDLNAGTAGLQLVVSGYALVFGVVLVPAGRAGDVMGRGRIFVIGMILFGAGSLASGLAPDVVTLNLARAVMGIGSGLLNPQVAGMIQQYYTGEARGRAFGAFGAVIGVSVAVGPVLSGGLIGWLGGDWGWRASFLINVPFSLLGVWAARRYLPASAWLGQSPRDHTRRADHDAKNGAPRRSKVDLDPVGMGLLAAGTLLIMIPFMEASAGQVLDQLVQVGPVKLALLDALGQALAGRLDDLRVASVRVGQMLELVHAQGDGGGHHEDAAMRVVLRGRLECRLHAHDGEAGQLVPERGGRNARRGVACDHDGLGSLVHQVTNDLARIAQDLLGGLLAIGVVGGVAKEDEVLVWKLTHEVMQHADAAQTGVEDPNEPALVRHRLSLVVAAIHYTAFPRQPL